LARRKLPVYYISKLSEVEPELSRALMGSYLRWKRSLNCVTSWISST